MQRFVVGTGRCGSTLLSRMLAESPEVLSLSEFFNGLDMTRRFSEEPVSGEDLAWLLAQEHPFVTMVLRRGYPVPEVVYPFDRPGMRYTRDGGLPYLLVACLPRIHEDPDALFDALLAFARAQPARPLRAHYPALFAWLGGQTGRPAWVERSGSSIDYVASLADFFPAARFVHLHRDGREAALSMREHNAFRLAVALTSGVLARGRTHSLAELGTLDGDAPDADPIGELLASRPPARLFGAFWSGQVERGLDQAAGLPAPRWLDVRFEDLLADPAATLERIAGFFALDPARGGWIPRAAALVERPPAPRRGGLAPEERAALDASCAAAMRRLGRALD